MKKQKSWIFVGMVLFGCGAVHAMLPPDASAREPQLRRERIAVDKKYEKSMDQLRATALQRHKDVTAGLDFPPWKCTPSGAPKPGASLSTRTRSMEESVGHRWLFGLSGLLVVGIVFWLIKQMTRPTEHR